MTFSNIFKQIKVFLLWLLGAGLLVSCLVFLVSNYSFIFSRKVNGRIEEIERIQLDVALIQARSQQLPNQLFSFAVAIRDQKSGEIVTASAEDRQWAVAKKGLCAEARYYTYPPWNLSKSGTYFNARLDRLYDCPDSNPTPSKQ